MWPGYKSDFLWSQTRQLSYIRVKMYISLNIMDIFCLMLFLQSIICLFTRSRLYSKVLLYLWAAGSLLCSTKFVLMKKCCQNIHILNSMILQLINITALWNTDVILWRDKLHSVRITSDRKCQLCSTKFVLMKKCWLYIYIYIYIYIYTHTQGSSQNTLQILK